MSIGFKLQDCRRCNTFTLQEVSRRILANGKEQFGWWCLSCKWWVTQDKSHWLSKDSLAKLSVDPTLAPIVENLESARCVVCNTRGAELHHWAPKYIFREKAEKWPKDYLCQFCHDLWHSKILKSTTSN